MAKKITFPRKRTREILGAQNGRILPAWVANEKTGFALSCPTVDSAV